MALANWPEPFWERDRGDGCVVQATDRKDCEEQETGYPVTSLSVEDNKTCCPTRLGSGDPHMDILDGDDMAGVCKAD